MKQDVKNYFENYGLSFVKRIANIADDKELCEELEIKHEDVVKSGFEPFVKNIIAYCNERIINLNYVFGTTYERRIIS
jgi:hypothetical protein